MGKLSQLVRKMAFMQRSSRDGDLRSSRRLSLSFGSSRASSGRSARSSSMSSGDVDVCDCEEDCCSSTAPDVPAGCLPVYVGEERRRFVVPTTYLANSAFQALLAKSEDEYGLRCDGGLRIAYFPDAFERLLWSLQGDATVETEQLIERALSTAKSTLN